MIALILAHSITILIATLIAFVFGMIWYHPKAFGARWAAEQPHRKVPDDYQKDSGKVIGASLLDALFFTSMALVLIAAYQVEGILLLALSVTVGIYTNTFAKGGSLRLVLIDAGFLLSQLIIITCVILTLSN